MKTIGNRISELERDLELFRAIQTLSNMWGFVLNNCEPEMKRHYIVIMLKEIGYSDDEIRKIVL